MIRFFVEAEEEMHEAVAFYEARRAGLGRDFLDTLERALKDIEAKPKQQPVFRFRVRRKLLPKFPYAVLYVTHRDEIAIVAIAHLSRRPRYWRGRL